MDASTFLPLTDLAFNVLVALKDAELHGYALIKELRARTGRAGLRTGTVYAALSRLQDQGLVVESGERPAPDQDDRRRRYYGITPLGLAVAEAEAARLAELLDIARTKNLLRDPLAGP